KRIRTSIIIVGDEGAIKGPVSRLFVHVPWFILGRRCTVTEVPEVACSAKTVGVGNHLTTRHLDDVWPYVEVCTYRRIHFDNVVLRHGHYFTRSVRRRKRHCLLTGFIVREGWVNRSRSSTILAELPEVRARAGVHRQVCKGHRKWDTALARSVREVNNWWYGVNRH